MSGHPPGVHDHDSPEGLIPVDEARARVLEAIQPLAPLQLPLTEAHGCVSAEDVVATESLPSFPSSAMDGFAVRASDVAEATPERPAELKIVGRAMIGYRPEAVVGGGEAVAIATGAPIPAGADTIVPIENAEEHGEIVRLFEAAAAGRHVRGRSPDPEDEVASARAAAGLIAAKSSDMKAPCHSLNSHSMIW